MWKMRSLSVTMAVTILFVGTLGTCQSGSVDWQEFKEAYGIDKYNSETGVHGKYNKEAANGFTGEFEINGKTYTLPVLSTALVLFTNETNASWFKKVSMTVNVHFYGSPFKVSTFHENCSVTVQYLGDKFDPLCENLNCQRYLVFPMNTFQKRELVNRNGWGAFQGLSVPLPKNVENRSTKITNRDPPCLSEN